MDAVIITNGTPKEIAALVLAVQERCGETISVIGSTTASEDRAGLANTIREILTEEAEQASNLKYE